VDLIKDLGLFGYYEHFNLFSDRIMAISGRIYFNNLFLLAKPSKVHYVRLSFS
jgi:hypothetical protein